jgi:hypothetical protein
VLRTAFSFDNVIPSRKCECRSCRSRVAFTVRVCLLWQSPSSRLGLLGGSDGGVLRPHIDVPGMQPGVHVDRWGADVLSGKGPDERSRPLPILSREPKIKNGTPRTGADRSGLRRMRGEDNGAVCAPKRESRLLLSLFRQNASRPRSRCDLNCRRLDPYPEAHGLAAFMFVKAASSNQSSPAMNGRPLMPSAGPITPSCSIRSINLAARL